jgi:hypothetical protein
MSQKELKIASNDFISYCYSLFVTTGAGRTVVPNP